MEEMKDKEQLEMFEVLTDGYLEDCYANGNISAKGVLKDGERIGYWELYYKNGNIDQKGAYFNGQRIGLWEFYYEDGELMVKIDEGQGYERHVLERGAHRPFDPFRYDRQWLRSLT